MCGISGILGGEWQAVDLQAMIRVQHHRGPDDSGSYLSADGRVGLGHNRLKVIDLSSAARQPFADPGGRYRLVFNGEIDNYLELRETLSSDYTFVTRSDTEVLLAAYLRWGPACLDKLIGMFAFAVWDERERSLFAARDRFGVKPLYYHLGPGGKLCFASEIKTLHASGIPKEPDPVIWSTYLTHGLYEHTASTFWKEIRALPPGHAMIWSDYQLEVKCWYDLADRIGDDIDDRPVETVLEEYGALLEASVRLRFRADVPVGINLSGGLDSSLLLACVEKMEPVFARVNAFTFTTGDANYDELPWVRAMLRHTRHPSMVAQLDAAAVPDLARSVQAIQDEPYGGLPTVAYAGLFERARDESVTVLLDGQGMDEQWAGYDYYRRAGQTAPVPTIQGTNSSPVRPECLHPEFRALAVPFEMPQPFSDPLRNLQYRDIRYTKIPRALRFNDRVSMRCSRELREPFLDHRLVELAIKQERSRKIRGEQGKWFLRELAAKMLPRGVAEAPKRPLQTPQREWLRGDLEPWVSGQLATAASRLGDDWLDWNEVDAVWRRFRSGEGDHSFFVWQWLSLAMMTADA